MKRRKLLTIMSLPVTSFAVVAAIACTQQNEPAPVLNAQTIIDGLPKEIRANSSNQELSKLKEKLQNLTKDAQTSFLNLLDESNKNTFEKALKDGYKISKVTLVAADVSKSSLSVYLSVSKEQDVKTATIKIIDLKQTPLVQNKPNPPGDKKPPDTKDNQPPKQDKPGDQNPPDTKDNQTPKQDKPVDQNPPQANPGHSQSPKPPESYVQKFETDLKKFQGYQIKTTLHTDQPESHEYIYSLSGSKKTETRSNEWTTQNDSIKGRVNDTDFQKAIPNLDAPEWNPNQNKYSQALKQRDELIKNGFEINPDSYFEQSYNFWYNQKFIAWRSLSKIASLNPPKNMNLDLIASAPQLLKPTQEVKGSAVEMNNSEFKLNLNSLKYLVTHNEMGQNPKMLAWKLLTLSDDIRMNQKSILSDHIYLNNVSEVEKTYKLFEQVDSDISDIMFYAENIDNKAGTMTLYVTYKKGAQDKSFKIDLNKANVDLKNDYDYIKHINDRTVSLNWSYGGWLSENDDWDDDKNQTWENIKAKFDSNIEGFKTLKPDIKIQKYSSWFGQNDTSGVKFNQSLATGGTAWVVDKIIDPNLPEGQHAFIIATNKHVLDIGMIAGTTTSRFIMGYVFENSKLSPEVDLATWAKYFNWYEDKYANLNDSNYEELLKDYPDRIKLAKNRLEENKKNRPNNKKIFNKQNSWLRNSGFSSFTWNRFETDDYSKTDPISSSALSNPTSEQGKQSPTYQRQDMEVVGFQKPMFLDNNYTQLNATDQSPSWLTDTRKNFINSIIYMPQYTAGHIYRSGDEQASVILGGGMKREEDQFTYTYQLAGPDLVLLKMVFKDSDLKAAWPALYNILQKPEAEQKAWFNTLDLDPRTDDRTNSYVAGYPGLQGENGRILSYRSSDRTATSSLRESFVTSGVSNVIAQSFFRDWDKETWDKYYAPYDVGGRYNELNSVNYPTSKHVSNPENGLYTTTTKTATESLYSGEKVNAGNSGSMVVDANFKNYAIVFSYLPELQGGDRTSAHHFVQHDPYARSNVLENERPNVRLELIEMLKKKNIKTLNLNPENKK
ncbi:proline-rich domain-containing protein [Mycoplasmopsis agassizii]|uniref:proline-rich domain-containing protein n=1 Tax=Mycoplasmopsis agassizii TaxID=33922 RepID=UPI0035293C41